MKRRLFVVIAALATVVSLVACTDDREPVLGPTTTTLVPPTTAPPQTGSEDCGQPPPSYEPGASLADLRNTADVAEIRGRRLRVGVSADTLLFGFRDPATGRLEGFDIDLLREVAKAIYGDVPNIDDHIEFRIINYAQRLPVLEDGSVDLVAHTMTINCVRWERIAFSTVYYDAEQKVLVPTDSPVRYVEDLDGERVCAAEGSTNIENIARYPVEVVGVPDLTDCLVLFQQSAVDAITGDDTVLAGFAAQDPYAAVIDTREGQLSQEPYGIGVNADKVDLVRFVNSVLEQLRANGRLAQLDREYLEALPPETPPAPVYGRPLP